MSTPRIKIPTNYNPKTADYDKFSPKRGRPFLFQVCDPKFQQPLYPVMLACHVNPQSLQERMRKTKSFVMTQGGYVEYIWPDELDTLSSEQTTGAFLGPKTGLVGGDSSGGSDGRQGTIAWERQEDMLELFHQNGVVYNSRGRPIMRGRIMCLYDRGIFSGHFTHWSVDEDETKPFQFGLSWEFTVEQTIYIYPQSSQPVVNLGGENSSVVQTISNFTDQGPTAQSPNTQLGSISSGSALITGL